MSGGSYIETAIGAANTGAEPFVDTGGMKGVPTLVNCSDMFVCSHSLLANCAILATRYRKVSRGGVGTNILRGGRDVDGFHEILGAKEGAYKGGEASCVKGGEAS